MNIVLKEYINAIIKEQFGQQMLQKTAPTIHVFLDMDGVLADYEGAVSQDEDLKKLKSNLDLLINQNDEFKNQQYDEIKKSLSGPQADPSLKAIKKALQLYNARKYILAGKEGFFLGLEPLPGAAELVNGVARITGVLPSILTAPIERSKYCEPEKEEWMKKHFAGQYDKFHCSLNKERYASPGQVLIDDREKYTIPFQNAGGKSILYKGNVQEALKELENYVAQAKLGNI